jgi:putative hemolysin
MNSAVLLWWLLGVIGLVGSALCSGLEIGMYSVNRVRLQVQSRLHRSDSGIARLRKELDHPASVLTSLLISNNGFNYLATLAITALLTMRGLNDATIIILQAVILTPVILVFGEAIPKEIFRVHADSVMPRFASILVFIRGILTAVLVLPLLLVIARFVARVLGVDPKNAVGSGRERMGELLKYGTGQLSDQQVTLIDRALIFEHTSVRDEMVALVSSEMIQQDWSRQRAAKATRGRAMRWVPVAKADHTVVGMVSVLDLHMPGEASITEIMKPPVRIQAGSPVRSGLEELNRAGAPAGIVEHDGRDIGIVTIKDLVEPLIG